MKHNKGSVRHRVVKCGRCGGRGEHTIAFSKGLFNCRNCGGTGKLLKAISSTRSNAK